MDTLAGTCIFPTVRPRGESPDGQDSQLRSSRTLDWQASYTTTASDGSFDFARLAPGWYVFAANRDFFPVIKGTTYYRRAFFPGVAHRSEASVITVDAGQIADHLRFFLPPDAAPQ